MRKLICILTGLAAAMMAFAQTPEEIISKMEAEVQKHENDGVQMTVDVKVPIIGTFSTKVYSLGSKSRLETKVAGHEMITWSDEDAGTEWTYTPDKNEIEITNYVADESSGESGDMEMFEGVTEGYSVSLSNETDKQWFFLCKKLPSNTDKDAPKTMNIVVNKDTYLPASLSAKINGVTLTMRSFVFGKVSARKVTFNQADYPTAKIIDKRTGVKSI